MKRVAPEPDVTPEEMLNAQRRLSDSRDELLQAVAGLRDERWRWRINETAGEWSIADCVEHLALAEEQFHERIAPRLRQSPIRPVLVRPALTAGVHAAADARVLALARHPRTTSVAPARVSPANVQSAVAPTGRVGPYEALDRFILAREQTIAFLRATPDLRRRLHDQPAIGPLDAYQWMLFLSAHTERHLARIVRLKKDHDHALHVSAVLDRAAGGGRD